MPATTRLYTAGVAGAPQTRRVAINTQGSTQQGNASLPANQSFATTGETQFTDPALANAYPLTLAIPPGGPCEQEEFDVVFSGYITTTQSSTIVFKLYQGNSATIGSNQLLASSTSATVATTTVPFALKAVLVYDSKSGKLTGRFSGVVGGTATALAVLSGSPPFALSINNTNNPVLTFTLTATFGTAATPNVVNLKDFGVNH
jgi:hypothetical protein